MRGGPRGCVVAVHDVAPRTLDACRTLVARFDAGGIGPLALLVVPRFHGDSPLEAAGDAARWLALRRTRGDEIVLHGYRHEADRHPTDLAGRLRARLLTAGEGEFLALDETEAAARLSAGLAALETAGLGRPRGFVAPAWLLGEGARRAAGRLGFAYTTTHGTLDDLEAGVRHAAPALSLSCRTPLRTAASRAAVPLFWRAVRRAPRVRFAFHPVDAGAPAAFEALLRLVAQARRDRPMLTYEELLEACRRAGDRDYRPRRVAGSSGSASAGGVSSSESGAPGMV